MATVSAESTNVLYVTQDDLSKNSGYAFRVDRIRRAFERAGARVEVIGYCSERPVIACTAIRSRSRLRRLWPLWKGLMSAGDCIVITSIGAPYNGLYALVARALGKRVIYDVHDPVQFVLPELFGTGPLMRLAMPVVALSEALVGIAADGTITASASAKEVYAKRKWSGTIGLAYNIRAESAVPAAHDTGLRMRFGWENATIVVYVGGLQRNVRGIERQIEALAAARAQGVDVALLLLGYGDRAYFESLGRSLAEQGALRFLGDVSPAHMRDILQQCDVAVSCEPIGYLMPSKYFDYVTCGVRVVAIDDNRDVVQSLGQFTELYDGSTQSLVRYFSRKPRRMTEQQTACARQYVKRLDRMTDEIVRAMYTRSATDCDEQVRR